ncbi:MAG TPA: HAMP domain-containing sensor histidine kinase, partial [Labilithrix sp.]|nr:HAMP domain-containing sensor histidine kinase [Labilithrix sp.]
VGWSVVFLAGYIPSLALEVVVLGRYLRRTTDAREQSRARLVLAALAIGGTFSMSDVAHGAGLPVPYLGAVGTFVAAGLLTTVVVRLALFDRDVSTLTAIYVLGMVVAFVVAYLVVLSAFAGRLAAQVFGAGVLTLLLAAVVRELALSGAEARARAQRLAVLGRFSAQMAHDIKGPLTALIGATQVLEDADDEATKTEFLELVSTQAKRIGAIVDRYDRMARVEPRKTLVRIDELVRSVARAHGIPAEQLRLSTGEIECDADPALVESAVENVVRNAIDAASSTLVTLETRIDANAMLVIRIVDRGAGMDARVLERALEDFFTTKPDGSGLGLAFVRRVLEAHGGSVTLASRLGPHPDQGTTVELRLPAPP